LALLQLSYAIGDVKRVCSDAGTREQLDRTSSFMDRAVPDALVSGYESLIEGLRLPDPDDRHVLAAAIKCNASVLVTFNLRDFPKDVLDIFDVEAMHPDDFIADL
jgi:predicted nucleic acid-binding protein